MEVGLVEGLTGRFLSSNTPISVFPESQQRLHSIREYLLMLFNTRRGAIDHLPDYGLPDISVVCDNMPDSVTMLAEAIQETVAKYEPRLTNVQVVEHAIADDSAKVFSVAFDLVAQVVAGPTAYFRAHFSTDAPVQVNSLQRRP